MRDQFLDSDRISSHQTYWNNSVNPVYPQPSSINSITPYILDQQHFTKHTQGTADCEDHSILTPPLLYFLPLCTYTWFYWGEDVREISAVVRLGSSISEDNKIRFSPHCIEPWFNISRTIAANWQAPGESASSNSFTAVFFDSLITDVTSTFFNLKYSSDRHTPCKSKHDREGSSAWSMSRFIRSSFHMMAKSTEQVWWDSSSLCHIFGCCMLSVGIDIVLWCPVSSIAPTASA